MKSFFLILTAAILCLPAAAQNTAPTGEQKRFQPEPYIPESPALHAIIAALDSAYFSTYNTCNLALMDTLMAEDMEFYHDRGGLMTSKKEFLLSIRNNICGKVTREAAPRSIEVYPIPGFGAVETGYHRFYNRQERSASRYSKYIVIWRQTGDHWQMTRIVSLH